MNDPKLNEALLKGILERKEIIPGGLASGEPDSNFDPEQLKMGVKAELEHTSSKELAKEIAKDHLKEHPKYYTKLKEIEESTKPIVEKQTPEERHRKHKEWRKKNPQKVRDQVARHQAKTNQNKNREDTRLAKERGDKFKNPACSKCGSKKNVQYDHQKGYVKGSSSTPLCHNCHTKRPQQNKKGDKSVKGGTIKSEGFSKATSDLIDVISKHMRMVDPLDS